MTEPPNLYDSVIFLSNFECPFFFFIDSWSSIKMEYESWTILSTISKVRFGVDMMIGGSGELATTSSLASKF